MRTTILIITILTLGFQANAQESNYLVTTNKVGLIERGTTVSELSNIFPAEQIKKVIGTGEFEWDTFDDYEIYDNQGNYILRATPEQINDPSSPIQTILLLDKRFTTDKGVGLNSTFVDILNNYDDLIYMTDMEVIHVKIEHLNASFSIQKTELLEDWWNNETKSINPNKIPRKAPLNSFVVWWTN